MASQVEIEAVWKDEIDVDSCVLALLALARQLQPDPPAEETEQVMTPAGEDDDDG